MSTRLRAPWDGLGITVPTRGKHETSAVMEQAGLTGWNVEKRALHYIGADGKRRDATGRYAVVRGSDDAFLGVVKSRYAVVQNEDAMVIADALVSEGFRHVAAGELYGGRKAWMIVKAPEGIDMDDSVVRPYVAIVNSHDSEGGVAASIVNIREVCWNTLSALAPRTQVSFNHTPTNAVRIAEAKAIVGQVAASTKEVERVALKLSRKRLSVGEWSKVLGSVVSPSRINIREEVNDIYNRAPDQREIRGTAWGAFNAFAHYEDHVVTGRGDNAAHNRFFNAMIYVRRPLTARAFAMLSR